jgi:hypothetical protein
MAQTMYAHMNKWVKKILNKMLTSWTKKKKIYEAQLTNLKWPVSVFFDACGAIDYSWSAYVLPCRSLGWEHEYRLNDKHMWEQSSTQAGCAPSMWSYHPYWSCVSWATWQGKNKTAFLQRGIPTPSCQLGACNPINFTILNPEDPKWKNSHKIGI